MIPRTLRLLLPLPLFVLSAACSSAPDKERLPRHLVFVTIDTLRADRLGCYGNREVSTPNLDRLAREGALARDATVHAPLTRPSHVSMFTGLYPVEHGIRDNVSPSLGKDIPILAEILRSSGFRTAAFVSSIVLSAQSGLGRGFETYSDRFDIGDDDARFLNTIQRRGDLSVAETVEWIGSHAGERMFVWLHLYDPHDPYEPPEPYRTRYAGRLYEGEVAWSDELLGRVDAALEKQGIRDETLLVATSDHGEGLGEHGEEGHGFFVYESTLRVPLIFRGPGIVAGLRLGVTARSVDLFPTLLELLGLSPPPDLRLGGRSLARALRGRAGPPQEATYAESLIPLVHYGWSDLHSVREDHWKYILAPRPELYDIQKDPGETFNLVASESKLAGSLRLKLERRLKETESVAEPTSPAAAVPADLREKLGALGYLGARTAPPGPASYRADPKDKVEEFKVVNGLMREGLVLLQQKDHAGSARSLRSLLGRGNESFEVHYYLGRALVGLGQQREAAIHFEKAIQRDPAFGPAYIVLADCRLASGDRQGAVAALRKGQTAIPTDPHLYRREGEIWHRLKKRREALRAFEAQLALAPKDALVRVRLGEIYRDLGELERAILLLREAVSLDPAPASYWNSLGMVLGGSGDLKGAEAAFREALKRDGSSSAQYVYNLGLALLRQGRSREAEPYFRKALEIEPRFQAARERLAEASSR